MPPSSSQLASSSASSPTLTTSESSSSAVLPSTFPTSQPTSPTTIPPIPPGCRGEKIPVQSNDDLAKIGNEPCYQRDGKYEQTDDIDAGNHSPIQDFTGEYNGKGKSISNLRNCLFLQVKRGGKVHDVVVKKALVDINDRGFTGNKGVISCEASGYAELKNNTVEDSEVKLRKASGAVNLGMLVGKVSGNTKLVGNQVRHSNMSADIGAHSHASVGILTGQANSVVMDSNVIDYCRIDTGNPGSQATEMFAGLMAGEMHGVTIRNSNLTNNQLVANTKFVAAGGVTGRALGKTNVVGTRAINNTILALRDDTSSVKIAVIVADAKQCSILNTIAIDNHIKSEGYRGHLMDPPYTGIVAAKCYSGRIENTLAEHSKLSSIGLVAVASAFADDCIIRNTTAKNLTITARQHDSTFTAAAIATAVCDYWGSTSISETTAIDCRISAHEGGGYAAVGVGFKNRGCSAISDTVACNSDIRGFWAGIATGNAANGFPVPLLVIPI